MQRDRIRAEAALWVVRLSDSDGARDRADFEAWRAQSVDHEIAYEREAAAWERLDRAVALNDAAANPDLLVAITDRRPPVLVRRLAAIAATALLALGGGAALLYGVTPSQAYATAVGEHRLVRLADGSTIELNTDSQVIVRLGHGTRSLELVHGEALFHVARDSRPFAIRTASGRIEVQAADVSVREETDRTEILVKSGAAVADGATGDSTAIGPGGEATLTSTGVLVRAVSPDELDRQMAWRRGEIALNGQTLAEAVAEFNRYNGRKIIVDDPAAAKRRVGGYFHTNDATGFVTAVIHTFPVVVARQDDAEIHLATKS